MPARTIKPDRPEAVAIPVRLITGVQRHPEQMFEKPPRQLAPFTAFVLLARESGRHAPNSDSPLRRETHV